MAKEIPGSKRCQHIGCRSNRQCKHQRLKGGEFCRAHDRSPTLPPEERTTALDMVGEILACSESVKKPPKRHISQAEYEADPENFVIVCGDRITPRCTAMSKRSRIRCKAPAVRGRKTCRMHGGRSRGPATEEGKARGGFQPVHGRETVKIRKLRSQKVREFRVLKRVIKEHGL